MALSIFEDKAARPLQDDWVDVLGDKSTLWSEIESFVSSTTGLVTEEWKHYGKASGWTLLLKQKKRTILYMFPQEGYFIVQIVLGEKAVERALERPLTGEILMLIKNAKPYIEGRSIRIEVTSDAYLIDIKTLIDIKLGS